MKKLLAASLALVSSLTMLTGCGGPKLEDLPTLSAGDKVVIGEEKNTKDRLTEALLEEVEDKQRCTVEIAVSQEGVTVYLLASRDDDEAYVDMELMGMHVETYVDGDEGYIICDELEGYVEQEFDENKFQDIEAADILSTATNTYVATYDVEIDGEKYIAEKFTDAENGGYIYHVFYEESVIGIINEDSTGALTLTPAKITSGAEKDLLKVPSGYDEISEEEYTAAMQSSLAGLMG